VRCDLVERASPDTSNFASCPAMTDDQSRLLQSSGLLLGGGRNTLHGGSAEIPSTNGHGTPPVSSSVPALLEPGLLVSPELLAEPPPPVRRATVRCSGRGHVRPRFQADGHAGRSARSRKLRHFRLRRCVGFADPDAGIAFGYVMTHVIPRWQSSRNRALIDASTNGCDDLCPGRCGLVPAGDQHAASGRGAPSDVANRWRSPGRDGWSRRTRGRRAHGMEMGRQLSV